MISIRQAARAWDAIAMCQYAKQKRMESAGSSAEQSTIEWESIARTALMHWKDVWSARTRAIATSALLGTRMQVTSSAVRVQEHRMEQTG